jgi:DNA repair exonuclease SbcCD ATPase subunit
MKEKMTVMDNEDLNQKKELNENQHAAKYNLHENQHNLTTVQDLLKDSGIKTVVIRNYLPLINQLINKYLNSLNFYINFQLDENFIETIKSRGRDEFAYGSFSEGEKLRIDLALLFTWREIAKVKSSVATNLLILDEIFDSSLDSTGIEDFLGILNSLDNNCNAFVISHKGHQIIDKFGRVIKIVKNNNFSALDSY